MRACGLIAIVALLALSCNNPSPTVRGPSPSSSASSSPAPTEVPSPTSYGLLWLPGKLQMITPSGTVAASAKLASPSRHLCGNGNVAGLQPPVSATSDKVYFRDGDTAIRYLTPDGQVGDATTVAGSGSMLSFFSVSPDDRRIAVVVEDFSRADRINLSLYVEDLIGHGNHKVIYTNSTSRYVTGRTLWPMGWHQGLLVLGVFPSCTVSQAHMIPTEWHVSNPSTAVRVAKIGNPCEPSYWPSPAGVACIQRGKIPFYTYDWAAKKTKSLQFCCEDWQSGLSPSGVSLFLTPRPETSASPVTQIMPINVEPPLVCCERTTSVPGRVACLWIDETHLLAPDAVIRYSPADTASPGGSATVIPIPAAGQCAGRFPGGL